jgi:hypothetical protein
MLGMPLNMQKILDIDRSCTHTASEKGNWWRADLAQKSEVNKIVIYNRVDCCSERIKGAKVAKVNILLSGKPFELMTTFVFPIAKTCNGIKVDERIHRSHLQISEI